MVARYATVVAWRAFQLPARPLAVGLRVAYVGGPSGG